MTSKFDFSVKARIARSSDYGSNEVKLYYSQIPTKEAEFAMAMIERWGSVAAIDDGEDSAGRRQLALMGEADVVSRAFNIAKLTFEHINAHGLFHEIPDLNEVNVEHDAKTAKRETQEA